MPDSGFFPTSDVTAHFGSGWIWLFNHMNSTSGVLPDCIAAVRAEGREDHECFNPQNAVKYIQTPCFALQSQYDSDQMRWRDININDTVTENKWGQHLTQLIEENFLGSDSRHGLFLDSCSHHCWKWGLLYTNGVNQVEAFQQWYNQGSSSLPNKGFFHQQATYPCESCCHPPSVRPSVPPSQSSNSGLSSSAIIGIIVGSISVGIIVGIIAAVVLMGRRGGTPQTAETETAETETVETNYYLLEDGARMEDAQRKDDKTMPRPNDAAVASI